MALLRIVVTVGLTVWIILSHQLANFTNRGDKAMKQDENEALSF